VTFGGAEMLAAAPVPRGTYLKRVDPLTAATEWVETTAGGAEHLVQLVCPLPVDLCETSYTLFD
jgi:hypothetical protein